MSLVPKNKKNKNPTSESHPRTTFSRSTPVSSAAAWVNWPPNTSLTSILSGQNKTAALMCSESVLTSCLTHGRHWILMWNMGYCVSHIHRGRLWCCSTLATVISWASLNTFFGPGHGCWNVWPLQTAERLLQPADPSMIPPKWTL